MLKEDSAIGSSGLRRTQRTHAGNPRAEMRPLYWPLDHCFLVVISLAFQFLALSMHSTSVAQEETAAPLPPLEAARTMRVPAQVQVTLFAGEPDVVQPIGFCIDDRRRLWVAEANNYPIKGDNRDRIIILTDRDGDGQHDERKVFYEGLSYVTGIEVGFGGAWVMSPPNMYFIPDRDGDDVPDGPAEVVLDGFGIHANAHNIANGFAWGPDGWLYGTHGRTNWSMIGKPGAAPEERVRFDGGVYRYHPLRRVWEPYADGTTNPWGIDWNDYGHAFVCNCVNPHLFQVIQGAHYEPWRGRESSQFAYQRIDTIADHLHFVGLKSVSSGLGTAAEDAAGGGHAHCGTMIYLGDNFPAEYRNSLFTNNIHGRRINNDILRREGSGYVASHGADLMRSVDQWFMGVTLAYGPAGEIYVSDWSDTGECHSIRNTRKETGRIYRLSYGDVRAPVVNVAELSNAELIELQWHPNDWYVRHARRALQERAAQGADLSEGHELLKQKMSDPDADEPRQLRALWALYVTGGVDEAQLLGWLKHGSPHVRSWVVTLLCDAGEPAPHVLEQLVELANTEQPPLLRLSLASALQRIAPQRRWDLAVALCKHAEDEADANIPLMLWYGCEPLVDVDLKRFTNLSVESALSRVRINSARRILDSPQRPEGLELLVQKLGEPLSDAVAADVLEGVLLGLEGEREVRLPSRWSVAYARLSTSPADNVRERAVSLAVVFDDPQAMQHLQQQARNPAESPSHRQRAIRALVTKRLAGWDTELIRLLQDPATRGEALRGLASFDHPQTLAAIVENYAGMSSLEKQTALLTLASRPSWARGLLQAIEAQQIPLADLTAYPVRLMRELGDDEVQSKLAVIWGVVRDTPQERSAQITKIKTWLTQDVLKRANRDRGHELFVKQCAACHKLFGEGGAIGPDITGAQRHNLDYLLENIIDPNAAVSKDYQMEIVRTVDGRVLTGLIETIGEQTLAVQSINERVVLPLSDIEERTLSNSSIMPQSMLDALSDEQIRDLIAFLQLGR
jgi:putative membrane-bound dehydrogenase-like protein